MEDYPIYDEYNGVLYIYIQGSDKPDVVQSLDIYDITYVDTFIGSAVAKVIINSMDLVEHKSKRRNDIIDNILENE